ncbi:MAG: nuclear transport factor 2 family protein [Fibrobacteria bacterium]
MENLPLRPAGALNPSAAVKHDDAAETALLETYYACLGNRDFRGMAACHHPDIKFKDPIFNLGGKSVAAMWHMLCESGQDMKVEASGIRAENGRGRARWVAVYTFSATGRKVVNVIDSSFRFQVGKIIEERDEFDFWKWSRQAMGLTGWIFGWMPRLLQTVQAKANGNLERFIGRHPEYGV